MDIEFFSTNINEFILNLKTKKNASTNTQKSYENDLTLLHSFWKNKDSEEDLNIILKNYIDFLYKQEVSESSIARRISCFNSFKKFLLSKDIKVDFKLKRPFIKTNIPETLDSKEITQLMDITDGKDMPTKYPLRDKAIIELLYATGLQSSELINIELQNIDFTNNSIQIRNKNKKERFVLFGSKASEVIQNYIKYERASINNLQEKLFLNYKNLPLTARSIQRICLMFRQCLTDKGIITPQKLRNSFAKHMLENGASLETVQQFLGHKVKISTERYLQKTKLNK